MSWANYKPVRNMEGISFSLGDLRSWHALEATCASCRRRTLLDLKAAERRHGNAISAENLAKKIKCSKCGNRVGNSLALCKLSRD